MSFKSLIRQFKRSVPGGAARSRILIDAERKTVAIANYKCGFTSLNRCLPEWDKKIDDAENLLRYLTVNGEHSVHMIVRDPVVRFQSFVHGWLVDKSPVFFERRVNRQSVNFAYENLAKLGGPAAAKTVEELVSNSDIAGVYQFLTDKFPIDEYIMLNEHTVKQSSLIRAGDNFIPVNHYYNLDLPSAMEEFSDTLGVRFPASNKSSRKRYEVSDSVRARIEVIYADDYRVFSNVFQRGSEA